MANDKAAQSNRGGAYSKFFDPANIVLLVAVVAALGFLVSSTRNNYLLSKEYEKLRETLTKQTTPEVGDAAPPFDTIDLQGNRINVGHNKSKKQLLFIFSTHCGVCAEQLPVWDRLIAQKRSDDYIVRGVSMDPADETKAYFEDRGQSFQIVLAPEKWFTRMYRVSVVPQVMVVSGEGIVEWVHVGALTQAEVDELASKLAGGGEELSELREP